MWGAVLGALGRGLLAGGGRAAGAEALGGAEGLLGGLGGMEGGMAAASGEGIFGAGKGFGGIAQGLGQNALSGLGGGGSKPNTPPISQAQFDPSEFAR